MPRSRSAIRAKDSLVDHITAAAAAATDDTTAAKAAKAATAAAAKEKRADRDQPSPFTLVGVATPNGSRVIRRKRLNVEFPHHVADQLDTYAEATGRSKTEFLRLAIGTYAVLCDELVRGNRVFITSPDAKQHLRELVLPA